MPPRAVAERALLAGWAVEAGRVAGGVKPPATGCLGRVREVLEVSGVALTWLAQRRATRSSRWKIISFGRKE